MKGILHNMQAKTESDCVEINSWNPPRGSVCQFQEATAVAVVDDQKFARYFNVGDTFRHELVNNISSLFLVVESIRRGSDSSQ